MRSTTFGAWVAAGSREEIPHQAGSAHYLEHVPFKATRTRSAMEISAAIEGHGGELNAFTSKEHTCFYARTLDAQLPTAVDVITELVLAPVLATEDIEAERGVILEEIAMYEDNPADLIHDHAAAALFGADHSLGRPILGTVDTIEALTPDAIREFYASYYRPDGLVISVAGNIDHGAVVDLVAQRVQSWLPAGDALTSTRTPPQAPSGGVHIDTRTTEQANIVIAVPGIDLHDERRWALSVLNLIFGGGMSSRLFDEVREKRGLAYSVYSYAQAFSDSGQFGVYVGCQPAKADDAIAVVLEQMRILAEQGLTDAEVQRGRDGVRGSTVLHLEDTYSRMSRLGKAEISGRPHLSLTEIVERIDAVTVDDVRSLAHDLLSVPPTAAIIGPFDADRTFSLS